ncbi:MGH1-like glycoside hydrolase domain-containing protein [Herbiconiux sp. P16]|uniref:MGH1-like glycoside hydrolase domain-containing protein n=1 Tax=Herbiconiux wuyangfengii TaxID=3342794 RepID=UPI0035BB91C7
MPNPLIPTVDDLAADPITHHYDDMVAPSGLTNFLGTVKVEHDLTALGTATFPPVSQGEAVTGVLFVDGRVFESFGVPVTHEWRADRVVRSASVDGLQIVTTTVCVPGETAVAIDVAVTALDASRSSATLTLALNARVTDAQRAWLDAVSPDATNSVETAPSALVFSDPAGGAWSVQGVDVPAEVRLSGIPVGETEGFEIGIGGMGRGGEVSVTLELSGEGSTARFGFVQSVATSREEAEAVFSRVAADVPAAVQASEALWNTQLEAIFTPGNTEYSGHLPVLDTASDDLRRLYWWGALGVIWFRREFAGNVLGRSYDTLMPNYWSSTTFIWDYSLSSVSHALLDPGEMRRQLTHWIGSDIHTHFGTSSITGGAVGRWYSVNDYAMTRLVSDYVRFTGDRGYLDEEMSDGRTVGEHLQSWAVAWKGLRGTSALADYGGIDNLLECVSSYTHEVASLNAANVWCLRTAATLAELAGDASLAASLRADAAALLGSVLDLYDDGTGHFVARQPDGSRLPVRHCYDFNVVGTTIGDDLPPAMRSEMVSFFRRELQTPNWMRALSPWDPDASFSVRPDHQWNGAYPAWPADAARALVALGAPDVATDWIGGLVKSTNQGPTGQAHFIEEAQPSISGGARKAPPQLPYITDWACSSSGAWVDLVIESLFGAAVSLDGAVAPAGPGAVSALDPAAVLRGLSSGGRLVDVHADGRVEEHTASLH